MSATRSPAQWRPTRSRMSLLIFSSKAAGTRAPIVFVFFSSCSSCQAAQGLLGLAHQEAGRLAKQVLQAVGARRVELGGQALRAVLEVGQQVRRGRRPAAAPPLEPPNLASFCWLTDLLTRISPCTCSITMS